MSNRDSLGFGDMVPQDVVDIFAHEKPGKNGRKKRSRSLGRALGWLKGKRRKDHESNRHGLSPSLDLALDLHPAGHKGGHRSGKQAHGTGNSHAIPKRDNDDKTLAPPLFQENVFESSSRPKYLEDLHTEALEGLKMMQQEETSTGVEYKDNESTISTMSMQTDGECGGFTTDSTIPDTSSVVSMQSSVSTKSSRSGLTRQGSTFRPLNSGKKSEKSRSRRRHRRTVAGIPQHVQKELGLDRVGWMMAQQVEEEQVYNGESDYSSTTEGPESPDGPSTGLRAMNVIHPLSKDKVEQFTAAHAGLGDNLGLLHHLDSQRSQSLAAPYVNSASSLQQELPSPVMSMSPQAAYMSKIIPNAVLPPSIDVVEISRGRSRNSVRTVSKSSLLLSSPAPSRASSRASSTRTTSSKASTITSRHNNPCLSDSNWSNSDSSDTLVSNSSTISTSSTPRQRRSQDGDSREDKISVHSNGKLLIPGDDTKKDGQFGRSLSIMKPKRAPPPPSRSYSLHTKMKRRSRDLAEVRIIPGESISAQGGQHGNDKHRSSPLSTSPGYNADTSSLDDSTESGSFSPNTDLPQTLKTDVATKEMKKASQSEKKLNSTISPSSGYSSREASSPQCSKQSLSASPKPKKGIFAKLQRLFPGSSSSIATHAETPENSKCDSVDMANVSPSVQALRELFNIPRHPKVQAPPPPPPEVWAHSKRTFELLLGPPAPENVYAIIKKNPKDRRQQRQSPSASTDGSARSLVGERKHTAAVECVDGSVHMQNAKKVQESGVMMAQTHRGNTERLAQNVDLKDEKVRGSDLLNGMLAKAVEKRKEKLAAKREDEMKTSTQATDVTTRVAPVSAISLVRSSPSPSPAFGHRIVQTPTTQTTAATVVVSPESSWPPPPPPMGQASPGGPDDLDFPLPPPPLFAEGAPVLPVQVPPNSEAQKPGTPQENAPPPLSIPPPPSYMAPPPPMTAVSPPTISKTPSSLPVIQEVVTPPPVELLAARPKDSSASVLHGALPFLKDITPTPVTVVAPPVKDVIKDAPLPPEGIPPPPPQLNASQWTAEVTSVGRITPPRSIPPPPPLPTQQQASDLRIGTSSSNSILAPPESIPPPPPGERLLKAQIIALKTNDPATDGGVPSPEKAPESSAPAVQEEPAPVVTPSLLQMVKLRSINGSPESPKAKEQPQTEVKLRKHLPSNVPTSSPSGEAPQKPIRRSLIVTSPTSTSPPATVESQPPPPKSVTNSSVSSAPIESRVEKSSSSTAAASSVVAPASTSTVTCTVETSPPATSAAPSVSAPPVSLSTDTIVDEAPPATTAASSINPAISMENIPPQMTVAPSIEVSAASASTVDSVDNSPDTTVAPSIEVSVASTVDSVEISPPATTAAPTILPIKTSLPVTTAAPTVVVSSASTSTVITSVERSPPASTAAPTPSPTVTSSSAEKSPPAAATVPPVVVSPASTATVVSPVKKSPSATAARSMNLQEAIRLRTAARSKVAAASRLSLQTPTSPQDFQKSPTSTASFIFSKTNKKVVIETKTEAPGDMQKSPALSPLAKAASEAESLKKGVKVPPPVAKKPKGKEVEGSEGTEVGAEQEAQPETIKDVAENGTAGTVEGEGST